MSESQRDISEMLAQMQSVQNYMQEAHAKAADTEIAGRSSDGSVVIHATLKGEFRSVEVDPAVLGVESNGRPRRLEASILAALADLAEQQRTLAMESAKEMASRFQFDVPGV